MEIASTADQSASVKQYDLAAKAKATAQAAVDKLTEILNKIAIKYEELKVHCEAVLCNNTLRRLQRRFLPHFRTVSLLLLTVLCLSLPLYPHFAVVVGGGHDARGAERGQALRGGHGPHG